MYLREVLIYYFSLTIQIHIIIFTEYVPCGTLKDLLHDMNKPLSWIQKVKFAKDIAAGMVLILFFYFLQSEIERIFENIFVEYKNSRIYYEKKYFVS